VTPAYPRVRKNVATHVTTIPDIPNKNSLMIAKVSKQKIQTNREQQSRKHRQKLTKTVTLTLAMAASFSPRFVTMPS
jgi:hypothetical protein